MELLSLKAALLDPSDHHGAASSFIDFIIILLFIIIIIVINIILMSEETHINEAQTTQTKNQQTKYVPVKQANICHS